MKNTGHPRDNVRSRVSLRFSSIHVWKQRREEGEGRKEGEESKKESEVKEVKEAREGEGREEGKNADHFENEEGEGQKVRKARKKVK